MFEKPSTEVAINPLNASPWLNQLLDQMDSLLLYQNLRHSDGIQAWLKLLQTAVTTPCDRRACLSAYGDWFCILAGQQQSWQDYLVTQILGDENPFTQQVQASSWQDLPPSLIAAACHDLRVLQQLFSCTGEQISAWVQTVTGLPEPPIAWSYPEQNRAVPQAWLSALDWGEGIEELAQHYRQRGSGLFAQYRAVRWHGGQLQGIAHPDPVQLQDLIGYETAKVSLVKNTEFLLAGYPALHVLLYGSRGSGKSSLVKALLTEYADRGLRLIEVAKADLYHLPQIVEQLRKLPQKFIVFVDDLSFEADDEAFKALKVVLEGSVTARPPNLVVYATSNRRHLVREYFEDRPRPSAAEEIHSWDTVQEKLSFSDRFGLTLTFAPADQDTYLEIVRGLAVQAGIPLAQPDLDSRALQWATCHNGRSGRTARQFIQFLQAEMNLAGLSLGSVKMGEG
uniref:AAA+ ATPase domain-containing protein n=1 Tax=Cyanothece sp. (strain PCC 7425 / ATCC 29141) TaxID=395961 RepID=B8HY27_CYAP4